MKLLILQTKFQGHQSICSSEKRFLKYFTMYGRGSRIGHVTKTVLKYFRFPKPLGASYET